MPLSTSLTLIDKLRIRDNEGWGRFVRLYTPLILTWARETGLQDFDCETAVSDVFVAVIEGIHRFQPGTFRGWLRRITLYKAADCHRRNTRQPSDLSSHYDISDVKEFDTWGDGDNQSSQKYWEETQLLYSHAVRMICEGSENGPQQWNIVKKTLIEGVRVEDVAKEFGYEPNSIYKLRTRVLDRLQRDFRSLIQPDGE
ncbi:MAG: RNA polymerase sigma factor [Planctomycetaceae bacterium]